LHAFRVKWVQHGNISYRRQPGFTILRNYPFHQNLFASFLTNFALAILRMTANITLILFYYPFSKALPWLIPYFLQFNLCPNHTKGCFSTRAKQNHTTEIHHSSDDAYSINWSSITISIRMISILFTHILLDPIYPLARKW
jgi:hypothetical protein